MRKFFAALIIILASVSVFSKGPEIKDISYFFERQRIFVSFALKEGFLSQDIIDTINSTNPITFKYQIELAKKKTLWIDSTILKTVIEKTIQYDNLTHQYEITIIRDEKVIEKKTLTSLDEVILELSKVQSIDLGSTADLSPGENIYYIRAKATLFKSFFLLLFPNDVDTGWKEKNIKTP
jgi:hypothetical protein